MWITVKNSLLIYKPDQYSININDELIDEILINVEKKYNNVEKKKELPTEIPDFVINPNLENDPKIPPLQSSNDEIEIDIDASIDERSICAFDFDSTLVTQKSGAKFPVDENDWKYQFDNVQSKLIDEHTNGNTIVIFSNQSGVEKNKLTIETVKGRFDNFLKTFIDIPIWCFVALNEDHFRKPSSFMWEIMLGIFEKHIQNQSEKIFGEPTKVMWDLTNSIYVGDAAGRKKTQTRPKDFSCSDRKFARNIGITFKTPEQFFLSEEESSPWEWTGFEPDSHISTNEVQSFSNEDVSSNQEIVVLVGPPSCGKSTFCSKYFPEHVRINMDTLKTKAKCIKAAKEALQSGKSIIVDNTNSTVETRKEYLNMRTIMSNPFKKDQIITTKCIFFNVDKELAHHLNVLRVKMTRNATKKLPDVSYNVYYKHLVEPNDGEGFDTIFKIPFTVDFKDDFHKKLFMEKQ